MSMALLIRKTKITSCLVFVNVYLFFRVYCPRNCMQANPHYARVIGTRIYSDVSILNHIRLGMCISGLPRWQSGKESTCQCRRHRFDPWVGKIP